MNVQEYSEYFSYWNVITSCSIETIEASTALAAGDMFREEIVMVHLPGSPTYDYFRSTVLFFFFIILIYPTLYYCRSAYCVVCGKKLVILVERCAMCRFVEAHPTDPKLFAALEEKGNHMEMDGPEPYPGKKYVDKVIGKFCTIAYSLICSCWNIVRRKPKIAIDDEEENAPKEMVKSDREAWLDDIYNFQDPDPAESVEKVPGKIREMREAELRSNITTDISSVRDRQKLMEGNIHQYVIHKAIHHPFCAPQPVGYGRQNKSWKEKEGSMWDKPTKGKMVKELDNVEPVIRESRRNAISFLTTAFFSSHATEEAKQADGREEDEKG